MVESLKLGVLTFHHYTFSKHLLSDVYFCNISGQANLNQFRVKSSRVL